MLGIGRRSRNSIERKFTSSPTSSPITDSVTREQTTARKLGTEESIQDRKVSPDGSTLETIPRKSPYSARYIWDTSQQLGDCCSHAQNSRHLVLRWSSRWSAHILARDLHRILRSHVVMTMFQDFAKVELRRIQILESSF